MELNRTELEVIKLALDIRKNIFTGLIKQYGIGTDGYNKQQLEVVESLIDRIEKKLS